MGLKAFLLLGEKQKHLLMSSTKRSAETRVRVKLAPWETDERQKIIVVLVSDITELLDQALLNS